MAFDVGAVLVAIPGGERELATPRHKHVAGAGTSCP